MPRNSFHRNSVIRLCYLYMAFDWIPCLYYKVLLYLCALRFTLDIQSFLSLPSSLTLPPLLSLSLFLLFCRRVLAHTKYIEHCLHYSQFCERHMNHGCNGIFLFLPFPECYLTTKNSTSYAITTGKCSRNHGYSILYNRIIRFRKIVASQTIDIHHTQFSRTIF